ncbi:MAG: lytic transglycosylase domain-containing protein [Chloroflexi bacterium]|nr:lytic transglycosylase domain-containing protein [Chloroflexota bacterium]MXX84607.1 lytic transglycosylase domain-containing protein [Chloroflexota bacterium]MYA93101.1 lytic transglycosylase domain-containing protein [Chloroflexota bacterium]MYC55790.1 lytic transglycosylase domain-containing protein [Chloroflexota bacterium]MYD39312.1 lytic transglycosylase domain-containing protein [Chloroflexota bacterium]
MASKQASARAWECSCSSVPIAPSARTGAPVHSRLRKVNWLMPGSSGVSLQRLHRHCNRKSARGTEDYCRGGLSVLLSDSQSSSSDEERCKLTSRTQGANKSGQPGWRQRTRRGLRTLLGWLRFCLAQVRGGRGIIKRDEVYYVPLWLLIALALLSALMPLWDDAASFLLRSLPGQRVELAEFFAPSVQHWSGEIGAWAARSDVDARLLATVMQIESCGHPNVISSAGARGLFQVMPFHFAEGENMLDPDTNARRGGDYLNYCLGAAGGVVGLALACYNGGPSVISQARESWPRETQAYYRWGVGIYSDATARAAESDTIEQWLAAGGAHLCQRAEAELGIGGG